MSGAAFDRRRCLRGLAGAGTWIGAGVPVWASSATRPSGQVVCVDLPAARALAASLAPHAVLQTLPPQRLTDARWWQALASRLQAQAVVAVLDERAAVLWDAQLTPAAQHSEHRLWRTAAGGPLHVLQQRFD